MPRLRMRSVIGVSVLALAASSLAAHELFLRLDRYLLPPKTAVRVRVLNGTFDKSESVVARNRIAGLTLAGPGGSTSLDTLALIARGDTSFINLRTGPEGTYVLGLSVVPRDVDYVGDTFNAYLKAEGYDDILAERVRSGNQESGKRRYATHVKAVFQVGAATSESYSTVLGFPAEIVPVDNPYGVKRGGTLRVRCLIDGQPAGGVVVTAGGRKPTGAAIAESRSITDADGVATVSLAHPGRWYVKFARMQPSTVAGLNYESQRTSLTFEVR